MKPNIDTTIYDQVINLGDKPYRVGELFEIEQENISVEYTTQASRLAYLGMLLAKAEVAYEEAKAAKEKTYAETDLAIREDYQTGQVKFTEGTIRAEVLSDKGYQQSEHKEREALLDFKLMRAIVDAMKQRGDMLISLGATLRQEYDVTELKLLETREKLRRRM